ncbi:uncharacterized protein LOC123227588 [Mangifera indica]|uniref:uncharacterized protein LOC123227588 n=1 Tax=Mangifera indica TaxID=29780 RepID=UPI001CFB29AB|nr:uncharacterized protein LOC123227588 [Mangifera indica]
MPEISEDLLQLEHKNCAFSFTESALLVCNKKESHSQFKKPNPDEKPMFNPLPPSQVLGRVKDFLGVMSEANKRLQLDAKDKAQDYDIEVLTGNESEVIEMDLMLGVADLHTPEAVMAAESAIAGNQPVIPLAASSGGTDSEGGIEHSDDEDRDDECSDNDNANKDKKKCFPMQVKRSKTLKDESEASGDKKSQKRPKIVEIS